MGMTLSRMIAGALFTLSLMACVSHVQKPGVTESTAIRVEATRVGHVDLGVESKTVRRTKGTAAGAVGAIGGAALGGAAGAVLGLGCGPAFFICSPVAAVGGAAMGGVALGGAAAVSVGQHGITGDLAKSFNDAAVGLPNAYVLEDRLHAKLMAAAGHRWHVTREAPNAVSLTMHNLHFKQMSWDRMKLVASARLEANLGMVERKINIEYAGAPRFVKQWASEAGLFDREIEAALDAIVDRAITALGQTTTVESGPFGEEPEIHRIVTPK